MDIEEADILELELSKLPKMIVDMRVRDENRSRIIKQEDGSLEDTIRGINAALEKVGAGKIVYVKRT